MIEVVISKIKIDELNEAQMIFLKEKDGERVLPIVIGIAEISAIKAKLSGVVMPRPLTHDLLSSIIHSLDASVNRIVIDRLEGTTFFAKVNIKKENGDELSIDARPSDSIALAVREHVPLFVEDAVLNEAGVYMDGGAQL